ncbi:hypothetical protein ACFX2I_030562 [Malus domestica]
MIICSDSMDSDAEALEEKLASLLGQLQAEAAILERMVYKNKNQHRRGSYFQHLMKVRRDLRLLQSTKLEELFGCCFQSITGNRPKQKLHLLESLKKRKCESGKHNFMERLLGAACLLSQILLDVVSVFNMVSSLCQKQQFVKIVQGGLEVFREFYAINEEIIILECVWKSDNHDGALSLGASSVLYQSTESFLGVDETIHETADANHSAEKGPVEVKEDKTNLMSGLSNDGDNRQLVERCEDVTTIGETPSMKFSEEGCLLTGTSSSSSSDASKLKSGPVKVAFIQVKTPSQSNTTEIPSKETDINSNTKEDSSFSLLSSGNVVS